MEWCEPPFNLLLLLLLSIPLLSCLWLWLLPSRRRRLLLEPPQPRGALPLLGHMLLLRKPRPLAHVLGDLADELGPVVLLRFGVRRTLVISSSAAARECLTTLDETFATRPRSPAGHIMGYDYAMMGFAPYGPYWRALRRVATMELLSKTRLAAFKDVRSEEIGLCVRDLYRRHSDREEDGRSVVVNMKEWMGNVTFNVVVKIVSGKRYFCDGNYSEEGWLFRKAISRFFRLMKTMVVSDMLPYLKWLDLKGHESNMKEAFQDIDSVVSRWLKEHRLRRMEEGDKFRDRDFMDTILSTIGDSELVSMQDTDIVIKALSMSLILGATDTTTNSLTLTLTVLLNHPEVLHKIQEELDTHVGCDRVVDESDIKKLVYLQAAVKEAFRLHPTAQFLQPHETMHSCMVGGYHVQAGTRLLVNVWKLQRNPLVWRDPMEFQPERFLTDHSNVDVRGHHFELIPFGSGRRSCPGITFGLHVMHLTLARLLHEFDLSTPNGEAVEMSAGLGSTLDPMPLDVVLTPRLPRYFHDC